METSINRSLYLKLSNEVDSELARENPDTEYIEECVDAMLRLLKVKSYQLTAQQREENIQKILSNIPQKKKLSKAAKVLLAAAIIVILLIGSVFAYIIIECNICDYRTYSVVCANIISIITFGIYVIVHQFSLKNKDFLNFHITYRKLGLQRRLTSPLRWVMFRKDLS